MASLIIDWDTSLHTYDSLLGGEKGILLGSKCMNHYFGNGIFPNPPQRVACTRFYYCNRCKDAHCSKCRPRQVSIYRCQESSRLKTW